MFKAFYEKKFNLFYFKMYNCKTYTIIKMILKKKNWFEKFNIKIYIDYLIKYQLINIFKILTFEKNINQKIIFTQNVIFDKNLLFDENFFDCSINPKIKTIINRVQFSINEKKTRTF